MKSLYPYSQISFLPLLFAALLYANFTEAQSEYKPLLNTSAIWNFEHITECEPYSPYYGFRYSLTLEGDTSINDLIYQKLYRPAWEFFTSEWFEGTLEDCDDWNIPQTGYVGALRENIEERKVYYIAANEAEEKLLYDFTLDVGDTLEIYFPEYSFSEDMNSTIDILDSVLINGQYHRRWIIEGPIEYGGDGDIIFVEGIGGMHGLVEPDPFFLLHASITQLSCYTNADGDLFPLDSGSCALITDVLDVENLAQIEVFPNPVSEHFSIDLPEVWVDHSTVIQVTDLTGRLIWESLAPQTSRIDIRTSNWTAGIYLLQVSNQSTQQSRRLVVQ